MNLFLIQKGDLEFTEARWLFFCSFEEISFPSSKSAEISPSLYLPRISLSFFLYAYLNPAFLPWCSQVSYTTIALLIQH